MNNIFKFFYLASLLFFSGLSFATGDACQILIPKSLQDLLLKDHPAYQLPHITDNSVNDIAWNIKQGGNGCWRVAIADFDGDGENDFLVLLATAKSPKSKYMVGSTMVVVAFTRPLGWDIEILENSPEDHSPNFVRTEKSGQIKQNSVSGKTHGFFCKNTGAAFGSFEGSEVVYCYNNKKWSKVWVSD